eukprot:10603559-Karenia_brevis.AAC.1
MGLGTGQELNFCARQPQHAREHGLHPCPSDLPGIALNWGKASGHRTRAMHIWTLASQSLTYRCTRIHTVRPTYLHMDMHMYMYA